MGFTITGCQICLKYQRYSLPHRYLNINKKCWKELFPKLQGTDTSTCGAPGLYSRDPSFFLGETRRSMSSFAKTLEDTRCALFHDLAIVDTFQKSESPIGTSTCKVPDTIICHIPSDNFEINLKKFFSLISVKNSNIYLALTCHIFVSIRKWVCSKRCLVVESPSFPVNPTSCSEDSLNWGSKNFFYKI